MTINQTLDKIDEHFAGILPAFMMLGIVVFIILGLGACVAPASALSIDDLDLTILPDFTVSNSISSTVSSEFSCSSYYKDGEYYADSLTVPVGSSRLLLFLNFSSDITEDDIFDVSFFNPDYIIILSGSISSSSVILCFILPVDVPEISYDGLSIGDSNVFEDYNLVNDDPLVSTTDIYHHTDGVVQVNVADGNFGTDRVSVDDGLSLYGTTNAETGNSVSSDSSLYSIKCNFYNSYSTGRYNGYSSYPVNYQSSSIIQNGVELPISSLEEAQEYFGSIPTGGLACGSELRIYVDFDPYSNTEECKHLESVIQDYKTLLMDISMDYPGAYFMMSANTWDTSQISPFDVSLSMYHPGYVVETPDEPEPEQPSGEGHQFDINYNADSDTYDVSLKRNGEPWYLSIKGKAFGWIPVYTYTTVQDESLDLSLSGLPSRFFNIDLDYHAEVYRAGSGLESSNYTYYTYDWTRSDFVDDNGNILTPDITGEEGEKVDFEPLIKPPFVEDGGYDTPGINDIDHDGTPNDEDDDMDGDGIPNEEDDSPYSPGNSGILGSLGFTLDFTLPDIESIQLMMKNMKLPGSLKEMFNITLPDEYKANIAVEDTHVLYGYQQIWFGIGDGVIGLVMGVVLVLAALVACIPRFLWEFFSSLIEWLNVAFLNFYDWLVIPSEIFKLVIDLLPDELLALALLLFGVDLVFLFFRFVIPGMISGSHAIGDIVEKEEKMRLIDEFGEETYNKFYGKKRGG